MRLLNQSFKDWQVSSKQWPVDYLLLAGLVALMVMGLTMVASSSVAIGEKRFDDPLHYLWRQLFSLGLGVLAAIIFVQFPLAFWRKRRGFLFLLGLGLLLLVLIFGREINGSQRWLPLGVMNFQVSEFMKMAVVLFMAGYLDRHGHAVRESYEAVFRLALPFGVMALLLLMEPDFGSTFVIAVILTGMLLIAGAPWRFFVITVLPIALLLITMVITSPYRLARVTNFLDPWSDPFGQGYQLTQALIASGRGEWLGVGLGESVQKLLYLPDAHTDFLFSIYAEELGLMGVIALVLLYAFILWRCFRIGRKSLEQQQVFGGLIAYGVGIWIALQAVINMGVNLGLFPTKGLTLPLMSYGGSSVLMLLITLAIVIRVDIDSRQQIPSE
ncbi:MAG: putative lipid II flippase FtsW [Piscirickettsiaceae bacterium CG_4_9_14_3_um_filter_43_564]|nr:putative lipid II flippase FtsW [Thiomicrospira sp.]OIP96377.1 MAG: putative lipid II flippase FtsW [Thiomicrospira sp. CG2_30_44_34]PIQ06156.1 MAG: putative lipid II flippase FtsW [Piscirickettsiaceae bacterium CG18_big_fil_WC_8_21_14_2_50_44_103]PIU38414.1 MAG: putative lipid II flippase FtsW [Piscirickettsiaceae bacterium CG07_land_8_20_14_0_80_44_28]PIW56976.1 MAG: putative lipid II flippase FtsW [Piscirickettsiaceae bacterium CG12_big_fil_rev_8_21_14_0_65_44_934]PIW78607.1 MAG: putativ